MSDIGIAYHFAMEVLADGEWHEREVALRKIATRIPPNLAIRRADRDREQQFRFQHPDWPKDKPIPPRSKNYTQDRLVSVGARSIARQVLANARFDHAVDEETGKKLVRLLAPEPQPSKRKVKRDRKPFALLTPEERRTNYAERARKGWHKRLIAQGIDPSTFVSIRQRELENAARIAAMSKEEKRQAQSEASKKGWETRRRNQQQKEQDAQQIQVQPGRPGQ